MQSAFDSRILPNFSITVSLMLQIPVGIFTFHFLVLRYQHFCISFPLSTSHILVYGNLLTPLSPFSYALCSHLWGASARDEFCCWQGILLDLRLGAFHFPCTTTFFFHICQHCATCVDNLPCSNLSDSVPFSVKYCSLYSTVFSSAFSFNSSYLST